MFVALLTHVIQITSVPQVMVVLIIIQVKIIGVREVVTEAEIAIMLLIASFARLHLHLTLMVATTMR